VCANAFAQDGSVPRIPIQPKPVIIEQHVDSGYYAIPPADSARMFDSIYKLRKTQFEERERLAAAQSVQDAFFTLSATISAFNEMKALDLNQYFAERALRPDPASDRTTLSSLDRYITIGGQFHLSNTIAAAVEYDFIGRYFNTTVDSLPGTPDEHLDMTYHLLLVGPQITFFTSHLFRLKATGGIGPAFVLAGETENGPVTSSRSSSATGIAISFDLAADLRVVDWASFTVDLFSRSISTGALTTTGNHDLSQPFGSHTAAFDISPNANTTIFGLAIGGVVYF
jgi:hypothetical protein